MRRSATPAVVQIGTFNNPQGPEFYEQLGTSMSLLLGGIRKYGSRQDSLGRWMYLGSKGKGWQYFDRDLQVQFENEIRSGSSKFDVAIKGGSYEVDLDKMLLVYKKDKKKTRKIWREGFARLDPTELVCYQRSLKPEKK